MSLKMSLKTEKQSKTLSLPNTNPQRFAQAVKRMRKLNKKQRAHYLDVLPDEVLDQHISSQTGIPRGTLADSMIAATRKP